MALPVNERSFPYHPGVPFTQGEIWGGAGADVTDVPVSGMTVETRKRIEDALVSTAEAALARVRQRVLPESMPEKEALKNRVTYDENGTPTIHISGPAASSPQLSGTTIALAVLFGLLIIGILKDARS